MPPSEEISKDYKLSKRRERIRRDYKAEKALGAKKVGFPIPHKHLVDIPHERIQPETSSGRINKTATIYPDTNKMKTDCKFY